MGSCPTGAHIVAYVEGALSAEESRDVEGHLAKCDACSRDVGEIRRAGDLIDAVACPSEDERLKAAWSACDDSTSEQLRQHMESCPRCREELDAVQQAVGAGRAVDEVSDEADRAFLALLSGSVRVPLSEIPLEEGAPPYAALTQLGAIEAELAFAGRYSGLTVAVTLRERLAARPLAGVTIVVQSEDGRERAEAVTDEDGMARLVVRTLRPTRYRVEFATGELEPLTLDIHR